MESFLFCASQKWKGATSGGRRRTHSLTPHRPSPVTSAGGLPSSLPRPRSGPPCAWTPSGETTQSGSSLRLAEHPGFSHNSRPLGRAAPHRSAHAPAACVPAPQSLDFSFSLPPSFFCAGANLDFLSSLFSSFFPPFFFSLVNARSQGEGASWRALECPGAAAIEGQRLEQFGADCRRRCPARGFPVGSPRARVPRSLVSWPSLRRVSSQLQRLGHCSWLLAEPWKPPRLNAAPADVTAACDQSAPRGPSVNRSASPPAGENAGRPRLEDQWRRARAVPATSSEMSWPLPGLVSRRFRL